jgi:methyl-accepting chemotaxis protein
MQHRAAAPGAGERARAHAGGLLERLGRLPIGLRLALAFAAVLGMTALLGATSLFSLARLNGASSELEARWMPAVDHVGRIRATLIEHRELLEKHTKAADSGYMDEYEEKMAAALQSIGAQSDALRALASGLEQAQLFAAFGKSLGEYTAATRTIVGLDRAGKPEDARDIADGAGRMSLDDALLALDRLSESSFAAGRRSAQEAARAYGLALRVGIGLLAGALVLGAALALAIGRGLVRQLGGEPAEAARIVRSVAGGDLSGSIPVRDGDVSSLMADLREMQASLARVVAQVREGSEGVASASGQIAKGNSDLSSRTSHQASALQETAASMADLRRTIAATSANARAADELARGASDVAARGGGVVSEVVQTMRGIRERSHRIEEIIGVIDGLAFQTNILALNAAVEAARAGEQGRGFAVVASEVRQLAQRSASSAREIKDLITGSVEQVKRGSLLADQAGTTMSEVVDSIRRVAGVVGEISTASTQQSSDIDRVGVAVTQIDDSTQQNASLVEESAAAAENLRLQARQLVESVATFRTAG